MNKSLFRYIWRWSRRDQLVIFAVVIGSLPFYYVSLDLPRKIVNEAIQGHAFEGGRQTAPFLSLSLSWPRWLGGGHTLELFHGFEVGRLELLFGLSLLFLFFVLVNGFFKYWINVAKGALGERMLRRLRFELFALALRFNPQALRSVKSSEAATIIKDEVEPIGGFIGDAFIQPMFLGTQAATALIFILMQSVWLGLLAGGVVGIQFVIIPRMRRALLRLGRMRQLASRRLAGRIGEVIDGMEAVQVHGTPRWERAEIGGRLYELFDIRFRIYKRKFVVKFLNNLLAQMTPFFFYAVGGYFALNGRLDIGQLVAVIAAYRELPPPLKELIDWDQQRLDVQVKYEQVVGYFASDKLMPPPADEEPDPQPLAGPLKISGVTMREPHGAILLEADGIELALPGSIVVVSDGNPGATAFARLVARREDPQEGEILLGERRLSDLSTATVARRFAYASADPVLFPGALRDNLLYGLRDRVPVLDTPDAAEQLRVQEAKRTGNPVETTEASWLDLERSGAATEEELDERLLALLEDFGLRQDVYRFGIAGMIDPERQPKLAERIVEARERLQELLQERGMAELVEPFDPERYNEHATIAENLLFGVPLARELIGRAMAENAEIRAVLDEAHLTDDLVAKGASIAETMTDIFRGLPPGHPLFDQFSFVHADELAEYEEILKRYGMKGRGGATRDDRTSLLALPLGYVEPRHRLGLLDDSCRAALLRARAQVRAVLEAREEPGVAFYESDKVNAAAPLRDNLLFGRTNDGIANAREQVRELAAEVIEEFDLRGDIERVGLDHQVGPAGRLLTSSQRASVSLVRCLVKRPDLIVLDGALTSFGERRVPDLLRVLIRETEGRSILIVLPNDRHIALFDHVLRFDGTRIVVGDASGTDEDHESPRAPEPEAEPASGAEPDPVPEADADEAIRPTRTAAE